MATLKIEGLDEPSASGGIAVLIEVMPSRIASRQQSGPSPVVQWVWNSTGFCLASCKISGTSLRVASGVSRPPGSLKQIRVTSSLAASRARATKYSSVCFGDIE